MSASDWLVYLVVEQWTRLDRELHSGVTDVCGRGITA